MSEDLISRQNAIDVLEILSGKMSEEGQTVIAQAIAVLKDLYSEEPEERTAKVETVTAKNGHTWAQCSRCYQEVAKGFPYCAGCGAKLDWSGNE